ncbi:MAG: hypothetical protein J6C27_07345 [Clostridia bacterium]|nr:hypothetical protein [Clostridia bacterium]
MNKDDILQKSREENKKKGDEREATINLRSYATSSGICGLICMVMVIVEGAIFDRSTTHIWIIYCGMAFTKNIIDAVILKKKSDIGLSILWGLVCIFHVVVYILDNIGG